MVRDKDETPPTEHVPYQVAALLSDENSKVKRYIEQLEAKIAALEARQNFANVAQDIGGGDNTQDGRPSYGQNPAILPKPQIVILVHGIRDRALWQSEVRSSLRAAGFMVELTNYGRFDIVRFLFPFPYFRRSVVKKIRDQIRTIKLQHPAADISIIAHSFGTYVISRVMREEFDIIFNRIVFCGGVYPQDIPFEQFSNRFLPPILNEVGARDYWPAVANSVTWGYGAPGTFGFREPLFEDRWHNNPGHSFFLTKDFCDRFWAPFMKNGTIVDGEDSPHTPHGLVEFISTFHIKYTVSFILTLAVIAFLYLI